MSKHAPRFIVMHSSEGGFETAEAAEEWIKQQYDRKEYSVAAIVEVTPEIRRAAHATENFRVSHAVDVALKKERHRIATLLGLDRLD